MANIQQKNSYRKFDLMMSVIELLKKNTGYIFRVYIENINGESVFLINKNELNRRKIFKLSEVLNVDENDDMINVTDYFLENHFGSRNIKLIDNGNSIILNDIQEQIN